MSLLVDQDLKTIEYLGSVKVVNKVVDLSDGTIVSVLNNGKITQIKKMGLGGRDDNLVTFNIPDGYHNNGFEAINYDEKHNHLLSLVSELNANGEVIASHIVIMNLNDGNTLADKKVLLEKGYDENNKYYEHYLIGETIRYFTDMNNDGKSEIIVDENILDGASLTFRSVYNKSFEGATTIIDVGDVNNDGISDLVNIGESEMRLYYSLKNGYDITYQKTNIAKSYDKKLQNNIHVKVLGDLDHDGIKDFVINAYNDKGCQCFQVIKGKDLSVRYSLLKDGVIYENEEDSFSVTGIDYDNDGVDDLVYGIYDEMRTVLSGATGEKLFEYLITDYHNDWDNSMGDPVPLENIVSFNLIENGNSVVKINDLNDDGIQELAYLVRDYDNSDYGTKNILKILNGSNYEELKSKILGKGNYDSSQITTVIGQSKLIYNDGTLSQIYDYRNDSLVAGLKMAVTSARTLNNQLLQLEDNVGQLYSFTDQRDFELVDFNEKDVNDGNLKISYKTEKNGLMYVYDQGNLIEKTTAKNFNVKLLAGEHDLIFSYNDGQGKVTHYKAIDDLSFSLEGGKIYGMIGPNGAGKSTTMSLLMGLIFPTKGSGLIKGYPLGSNEAKAIMGYSPEFPNFYSDMSCLEYLVYMGMLSDLSYDEALKRTKELLEEFDLVEHQLKRVAKFSTGMKKKVGLIQAMMHKPEILLLDEPTANLDPTSRYEIIQTLKRLVKQRKMTVLISSHVLTELEMIIDHVIMINKGHVVLNQPIDVVQNEFNQEKLLVSCNHNEHLQTYLETKGYFYTLNNGVLRVSIDDKQKCKKEIVKFIYENDYELDLLKEDTISLEGLYQQLVEENDHESTIQ